MRSEDLSSLRPGTETLRGALAADLAVPAARLGVVSKRPQGVALVAGVRAAVRVTLTQLTCTVITTRIAQVMRKSLQATEAALGQLSVRSLDQALFENSLNDRKPGRQWLRPGKQSRVSSYLPH